MTRSEGTGGVTPRLTGADLLAAVPTLHAVAEIAVEDFRQMPGASLGIADVVSLVERLHKADTEAVSGIVVTQGTDTLEEVAYLVDLYYWGAAPVVLTGAMRNPASPGADGPANLAAAVQAAVSPSTRGQGALVVFADEIHAARHVRKTHSTSIAAFASPGLGPVGHIVEGVPRLYASVERHDPLPLPGARIPRVELITAVLGSEGLLLDRLDRHLDGLVLAAFGAGHVPASWCDRLEALAAGMPVVFASRTGAGSVLGGSYAFAGSESDLLSRGLISAGAIDPYKARLLLTAQLGADSTRDQIEAAFAARR